MRAASLIYFGLTCLLVAAIPACAAPATTAARRLTLESCIRTALENHGDVLAAADNVMAAGAQVRGAGSSLFYPTLSSQTSHTEGRTTGTGTPSGPANTSGLSSHSMQQNVLRLGVTLWDGGVQRENVRRTRAGQANADAALRRAR